MGFWNSSLKKALLYNERLQNVYKFIYPEVLDFQDD